MDRMNCFCCREKEGTIKFCDTCYCPECYDENVGNCKPKIELT